jgi:hypothetical protein
MRRSPRLAEKYQKQNRNPPSIYIAKEKKPPSDLAINVNKTIHTNGTDSLVNFIVYGVLQYKMGDPNAEIVKLKTVKVFILTAIFVCIKAMFAFFLM